jgi:diguanylate cyclase (GGDEF)-like protein
MKGPANADNPRILIVDDNEAIHQDFRKILGGDDGKATDLAASEAALFGDMMPLAQARFELNFAFQGEEALAMLIRAAAEKRPYALAFIDTRMPPGWDGIETIERLWQIDSQLQIALCTAYSDYSWEALSQRLDPRDRLFILKKPFDNIEIRQMASALTSKWQMSLDAVSKISGMETSARKSASDLQKISHLAEHNILTDLPNGILLNHRLTQAIALSDRHRKKLAVMVLEVDCFERTTYTLGTDVADEILRSVAGRLVATVRKSDPVFHRSAAEFVLVLEEVAHPDQTIRIAEKLLAAIAEPHRINGHDLQITASLGISIYANDGEGAESLIRKAETAMYSTKQDGRGGFRFFESGMNTRARERQSMATNLHKALERGEFVLHYQPKVNLSSGAIVGAEALLRWPSAELGFVPPEQFIPVAEDCGLILSLGRWVLFEVCRQARVWEVSDFPSLSVAVNVSALEFENPRFLESIRKALRETGLDPRLLELELTESILIKDSASTVDFLKELKDLGVRIAIDDFGTGYSSLSYLKRFPVDTLKIDQSFVRDITTLADDATIVSAIINLGKRLGFRIVAEGLETREQLILLKAQGCDEGQGYYFSEAVAAEEFTILLTEGAAEGVME